MEKQITMSEKKYQALRAAAELAAHPEAVARTILATRASDRKISLEDAIAQVSKVKFPQTGLMIAEAEIATEEAVEIDFSQNYISRAE